MKLDRIKRLFAEFVVGKQVKIGGWIRIKRDAKGFSFLEINDGSCLANIQVIADQSLVNYNDEIKKLTTLNVTSVLVKPINALISITGSIEKE